MTKHEIFDHRRPITCADRVPIQYGEEHKFATRFEREAARRSVRRGVG